MKKILTSLGIILMAVTAKAVDVSTAEELKTAVDNNSDVTLTQDIDIASLPVIGSGDSKGYLFTSYTSTLDGNNHVIKNSTHPLFRHLGNATVKNITLDGFTVTDVTSVLACTSSNSTFSHITVKNSSLRSNNAGTNVAMIAGYSDADKFEYCTVSSGCTIDSQKDNVGGIAGSALNGGTFSYCNNGADISTNNKYQIGGIVGNGKSLTFTYCLNTGIVNGDSYVGGIVGDGDAVNITYCVNTGTIQDDGTVAYLGGIIGRISNSSKNVCHYCINFGYITGVSTKGYKQGITEIIGSYGKVDYENCYIYCYVESNISSNLAEMGTSYEAIQSGEFAHSQGWLYQDLDNYTFSTHLPTPIPAAGEVYTNILCDGTQSYSNKYNSIAAHTEEADNEGYCKKCGRILGPVHVSDVAKLKEFAYLSNNGTSFSGITICLDNDIDLSGMSANSEGYLFANFQGNIDGQNHTLKNSTHGLFYRTSGATIKNLTLDGFTVTQQTSLIARTSGSSNFDHVTVKNSSINYTGSSSNNFGMIVGYSDTDNLSYCTVESGCSVSAKRRRTGGLVGEMYRGKISYCRNSATVTGDADYIGGIVAYTGDSDKGAAATIEYCLNTGTINGDDECGGIAGQYYIGTISHCVNTGTISSKDGDNHSNVGGIVGKLCTATCENCINLGSVAKAKSQKAQFAIYGGNSGTISATGNDYYCDVKGKHFDNSISYDDIMSGKFALSKGWLYQDIDNGTYTATTYPVPLPEAGKVYSNILCDGTQSYSNKHESTCAHTSEINLEKYCTICGNYSGTGDMHIRTAASLCEFAEAVNNGNDYSRSTIYLDNDIDMSSITGYTPIGTEAHPYCGTFDGQKHSILNLTVNLDHNYAGLFGVVAGENTIIRNTIIDSSCSITSTASAVAGLVGGVNPTNAGLQTCKVTIQNCGNEASVSAAEDAAGILGGVYAQNYSVLEITNCYNTGAISSTQNKAAAICGYARVHNTFANCYNSGSVTGVEGLRYFFRYINGAATTVTNCYDINGTQVKQITADQVASGELCFMLNGNKAAGTWGQTCVDAYPVLSGVGMQHYSRTTANRWSTICLPFDVNTDTSEESEEAPDYDFYVFSGISDNVITLTKVTGTLTAGTSALVRKNTDATEIDIPAVSGTTFSDAPVAGLSASGLTLTGTFAKTDITDADGYTIDDNAFWDIADIKGSHRVYCSPFSAYLAGTVSNNTNKLTIGELGAPTAINEVMRDLNSLDSQNDHSTTNAKKLIVNGRLIIIKDGKEYNSAGLITK